MTEQDLKQTVLQEEKVDTQKKELFECRKLLSPCNIDVEDTSHIAVDDLRFALEQKKSKNIALMGHYGSGKSSVVNTCIDEMEIGDKVLRISMSTFSLENTTNSNDEYNLYSDDIEYKIVQHLLYKCDKSKIPYSRFQLIPYVDKKRHERYILLTILAFCCFVIVFEPAILQIKSFYDAYNWLFGLLGKHTGPIVGRVVNFTADACSIVYLTWYAYKVGLILADRMERFRNFKFEAQGVSLEASTEVSVFNKYLDEIIYILQSNYYNYILFEDLDRLPNSDKLFLKIRELNMLINESETFKNKDRIIKFIYAIRDDVFTREIRTKCFDYIVAVVPVVDHYNLVDYLIKEYQGKGLFKTIETAVIEQLLSNVSGLRELKNIVNEYILFQKSLKTHISSDYENNEQKLLAIIIYKNLFPKDFSKAYLKHGLLYAVFNNKLSFSADETEYLQEKADTLIQSMNEARKEIVGIRKQYLEKLNDVLKVTSLIKDGYDYTLNQVANNDNLFELFINDEFDKYIYYDNDKNETGSKIYKSKFIEIEKKISNKKSYYDLIGEHLQTYKKCNDERVKIEKEIKVVENTALKEVLKKIGGEQARELFSKIYVHEYPAPKNDYQGVNAEMVDTLLTMVFGGYIAEDYYLYISKFYEGTTSESDYKFTNAVLQGTVRPYDQKLNNVEGIVLKLRVENFKNESILNYDILNYLLDNKKEHFLTSFIETVRTVPEFIVNYFQMSEKVNDQFFTRVFDCWDSCVNIIKGQEKIENSETLLKLFFREAPLSIKLSNDEIKYLESKYELLNSNITFFNFKKITKFVQKYNLCFETLVKPNKESQNLYDYCLNNMRFVINKKNLGFILGENLLSKPMTAILELTNETLKKYLLDNQKVIVTWLDSGCNEESRVAIVYLIKATIGENEWVIQYIRQQLYEFDDVSDLNKRAVRHILAADKLAISWPNVIGAYQVINEIDKYIKNYLIEHADILSTEKCVGEKVIITQMRRQLFSCDTLPMAEFVSFLNCFDMPFTLWELKDMKDEQIEEVIRYNKVNANPEIFKHLNLNCSNQVADNYLILHFDALMDDETIELEEYVRNSMGIHVLNSNLTLEQKKRFLDKNLILTKEKSDSLELAKLVCEYYNKCGVDSASEELIVDALNCYQGFESWRTKITLVNKCNEIWIYEPELENKLLNGLGGEYHKLTYNSGMACFDTNEQNFILLNYLKRSGHYISKVEEKESLYYVTFKHS